MTIPQSPDQVTAPPVAPVLPTSRWAKRAMLFVAIVFGVNIASNAITRFIDSSIEGMSVGDPAFYQAALAQLAILVISRLINATLLVLAFVFAARALRETADGTVGGRGQAKTAIVLASILAVFLIGSTMALFFLY